jgi:SnoaL-like domain
MSDLESEIRVLLDKQALYELLIRYARGVDRNDRQMVLACFHPDAFLHYNTYRGNAVDFFEMLWAATDSGTGGIPRGQHVVTNALFDVRGDIAYGESYLEGRRAGLGTTRAGAESQATGPGFPIERIGRFIDRFERRDGAWAIASRRVAMEWMPEEMEESPVGEGGYRLVNFAPTRYDDSDPSYERDWN